MTTVFKKLSADNTKYTDIKNTIDYQYKEIPPEVCDWCLLHNHPTKFICDSDLKRFNNKLPMNIVKVQQDIKFVEYPEVE